MNILKHELKQNLGKTIIWIMAILAVTLMYLSIFSELSGNYNEMIQNFPEAFKKTLGITSEDLSTFPALYAVILNIIILVGSVQAMNLGVGIISKEVRDKTADFLLAKPVKRQTILTQKMLAGLVILIITNIFFLVGTHFMIQFFIDEAFGFNTFLISSLALFLTQLFFFALGYLLGSSLKKVKSVIAISLPVVFGFYVFGLLDTVIGVEKIKWLTPFKFFNLSQLTNGSGYETALLIYFFVLVSLFVAVGYYVYQKKDIHTL